MEFTGDRYPLSQEPSSKMGLRFTSPIFSIFKGGENCTATSIAPGSNPLEIEDFLVRAFIAVLCLPRCCMQGKAHMDGNGGIMQA